MQGSNHSADLVLFSFGECDVEALWSGLSHGAGFGEISFDVDSCLHRLLEAFAQVATGAHTILFVVCIVGVEKSVGYAAVIGENDQSA